MKKNLSIAYAVKKKSQRKKMAEGGSIRDEKRPMPEDEHNDSKEISRNDSMKAPSQDSWIDRPTEKQAVMNNGRAVRRIKRPSMVPTDAFSVRLRDEEDDLQSSAFPGPYGAQPSKWRDEEDATKMGSDPDMAETHSTHRKPYAKGGEVESSDYRHEANKHEDDLTDLHPSEDEGASDARSRNEVRPDRQGPAHIEEDPHSEHDLQYSQAEDYDHDMELNPAHDEHTPVDSMDQPEDEEELDHAASIASAIMVRRARKMFARGGEILSEDSMEVSDDDQADLSRNAEEDANMEDKASFDALRKENYSESDGLRKLDQPEDSNLHSDDEELNSHDKHDMVSAIRRKMKKSPISR